MTARLDAVVVGAGIHGCGIAQSLAAAGYSVLVLERSDVAAGTSSRSSKLIHGGLRYLETAQFRLVRESLRERAIMRDIAPELARPVRMHLPVYRGMHRGAWTVRAGLSLYALLGGGGFESVPRVQWAAFDGLDTDGLDTLFAYTEMQTDDAALCRAVLASACALGADYKPGADFTQGFVRDDGVTVHWTDAAGQHAAHAAVVVNAAGPWVAGVAARFDPAPPAIAVDLVQGAHAEYQGTLAHGAYYIESPVDGRPVFVLPYGERTLVGTTETRFRGDPDTVRATPEELDYLHRTLVRRFPGRAGERPVASWAGLRVLPSGQGAANRRSRETRYGLNDRHHPRVLSVYGGKLTTWRATAAKVLARLQPSLPARVRIADTTTLRLG